MSISRYGEHRYGELLVLAAFILWGLIPIYFDRLNGLPVAIIFASRIIWTLPCLLLALMLSKTGSTKRPTLKESGWALLGAVAISISWVGNLWGAVNGQLVAVSLAFFLSPVLTIALSVVLFREQLNKRQWISFAICSLAFLFYCLANGELPWLTIMIASAFSGFGIIKRKGNVQEIHGLAAEVVLMLPISLWILSDLNLTHTMWTTNLWLWLIVPVYYLPLMLYGSGVRRVQRMSTAGMMTYIEPVIMLILALTLFQEQVSPMKQIAIFMVWGGVILQLPFERWLGRGKGLQIKTL